MLLGQGMDEHDAALVEFLNDARGGPNLVRRLADTVADGRMLAETQLDELNELLARTPVTSRLVDGGEGRYARYTALHYARLRDVLEARKDKPTLRELKERFG